MTIYTAFKEEVAKRWLGLKFKQDKYVGINETLFLPCGLSERWIKILRPSELNKDTWHPIVPNNRQSNKKQ
jgi:hypothetical protein